MGQHRTAGNPMQCCPRGSRQFCIRTNPVQCCLKTLGITLHRSKLYAILSERLQTTLHKKTLCNFALILLGQHCAGQNPMQYCPKGSRQHCIRRNPMQCCLNTLWATMNSYNPMQCCPRCSRQLCIRKMFHWMLAAYAILVLSNVVPEVPTSNRSNF